MKLQLLFKLSYIYIYNKVLVFFLFIIMIMEFFTMSQDYESLTSLQSSISIKKILTYLCNFVPVSLENYYN